MNTEKAIFISDPKDLKYFQRGNFDRLYFGNEFCQHLLPSEIQLRNIINFVTVKKISFTFVTCVGGNGALEKLNKLLDILPQNTEVVFNDWGMADLIIKKRRFIPVHGRMLCSVKKDPRINSDSRYGYYFKSSNIQTEYQRMLVQHNILRVELDNVKQGYNLKAKDKVRFSLYHPFVQCGIMAKCLFSNHHGLSDQAHCFKECFDKSMSCGLRTRGVFQKQEKLFIKGNAQYYINDLEPAKVKESFIDRWVYMPKFPNQNAFSSQESHLDCA